MPSCKKYVYSEVWYGHFGDLDNFKVVSITRQKAAKTHRSIMSNFLYSFLRVDLYRISIVDRHMGILLHWP